MKRISKSFFIVAIFILALCATSLQSSPPIKSNAKVASSQDTLFVEPFISLFVQPIRPLSKEIFFDNKRDKDSLRARRVCPYYIQISVAARIEGNNKAATFDSLETIQFELETKITSQTYVPPVLKAPGAPANQPVITNTCGTSQDDQIFILKKTILKASREDIIVPNGQIGVTPAPYVTNSIQSNTTTLLLHRNHSVEKKLDNLFIFGGGIVIAVEEVIDPPNWLYYSIKNPRASRKEEEINWKESKYDITCSLKKRGVDSTCRRFACENSIGADTLYHISKTHLDSIHHPYRMNRPENRHAWQIDFCTQKGDHSYTTCEADSKTQLPNLPIALYQFAKFDSLYLSNTRPADETNKSFLGYVYKSYKYGTYPLFQAERNNPNTSFPKYRYSICLDDIVYDPNYRPKSILCYVFPPKKEVNPCPID